MVTVHPVIAGCGDLPNGERLECAGVHHNLLGNALVRRVHDLV
jgi:hypothetical protein